MARLTEVVDLPTPPLPDATATIDLIPGTGALLLACLAAALLGVAAAFGGVAEAVGRCEFDADPPARSAVKITVALVTPSNSLTARCAARRIGSSFSV